MQKLVACYITENDSFWLRLSLKGVLPYVDKIIIIDGGSMNETLKIVDELGTDKIEVHGKLYQHNLKCADGMQRNEYLKILKKHHMNDWCICLDSDEIVSDNFYLIHELINKADKDKLYCFNVKMEHFMWNFRWVDDSLPEHFVPRRLFKVTEKLSYPEVEHPILMGHTTHANFDQFTIFHCSDLNGVQHTLKKYDNNLRKSNIHTPEHLEEWKKQRLLGTYPVKEYKGKLPMMIREEFDI